MKLLTLINTMIVAKLRRAGREMDIEVMIVVDGVQHPIGDVWYEEVKRGVGVIYIGDDPR